MQREAWSTFALFTDERPLGPTETRSENGQQWVSTAPMMVFDSAVNETMHNAGDGG